MRWKGEIFTNFALHGSQHGCLEAGEGKVVFAGELGDGQMKGLRITELGYFGDGRATRVGQANNFSNLIECLADGVVLGLADELVVAVILEKDEL